MGTIIIIVCGLIGACSASKQSFLAGWSFLVNFCIALYLAIFLAPTAVSLMEIPGLPEGIKIVIAVGVVCVVLFLILKKIAEQVFPGTGNNIQLPSALEKISSACTGLLSGFVIGGLVLFIVFHLPFEEIIPEPMQKNFRSSSRKTLRTMIGTVNVFSFQSITPAGREDLRSIGLFPKKKEPAPPAAAGDKPASQPENPPAATDDKSAETDNKE